jgi:hypothetical protein
MQETPREAEEEEGVKVAEGRPRLRSQATKRSRAAAGVNDERGLTPTGMSMARRRRRLNSTVRAIATTVRIQSPFFSVITHDRGVSLWVWTQPTEN